MFSFTAVAGFEPAYSRGLNAGEGPTKLFDLHTAEPVFFLYTTKKKIVSRIAGEGFEPPTFGFVLRERDSNPRPLGYEPNKLPLLYPAINTMPEGIEPSCKSILTFNIDKRPTTSIYQLCFSLTQ